MRKYFVRYKCEIVITEFRCIDWLMIIFTVQASLVICGLFICDFADMHLENVSSKGISPRFTESLFRVCKLGYFHGSYLLHIAKETRSQSYQTLIFPVFQFSVLSLRVCSKRKKFMYCTMAKLSSKKRINSSFPKKKSLVGLTPES